MRSVFGFFCTLSALISTCYSLSCTKCSNTTTSSCTGSSITCPADQVCGVSYTLTTEGGVTSLEYSRDCFLKEQCTFNGSMGFAQNSRVRIGYSCCSTDNCLPSLPALPADNNKTNGLVCRSCSSQNSVWCYTSDTIQCTGDENMCLLQTTKITTGSVSSSTAIRGCATKSICDLGRQAVTTDQISVDINFQCTSGSVGVFGGVFLNLLLGIVLTKLLC
ncbi:phospholipase A2 inhibitor gamma subunit B-like [Spea bombifrons]|uniref:phospholipase A2 inhibitor gamma subunit B-like n=1 Tax=Spea bombifrons TaxID=233779 RepID=UPI00234BBD40|nr:phospholipase A2 inhibitor gamma subunit B-like [Spea bombifrons]